MEIDFYPNVTVVDLLGCGGCAEGKGQAALKEAAFEEELRKVGRVAGCQCLAYALARSFLGSRPLLQVQKDILIAWYIAERLDKVRTLGCHHHWQRCRRLPAVC